MKSKMWPPTAEQEAEALEKSIAHWGRLAEGKQSVGEGRGSPDCALCGLFLRNPNAPEDTRAKCNACPVGKAGFPGCTNPEFLAASNAGWNTPEFHAAAAKERDFLIGLRKSAKAPRPLIEMGKQYTSRGEPCRILCVGRPDNVFPVIGLTPNGEIRFFMADGRWSIDKEPSPLDLELEKQTFTQVWWVNVYKRPNGHLELGAQCSAPEQADKYASELRGEKKWFARARVEIKVSEGEKQ